MMMMSQGQQPPKLQNTNPFLKPKTYQNKPPSSGLKRMNFELPLSGMLANLPPQKKKSVETSEERISREESDKR
jgi:hypothetical protein